MAKCASCNSRILLGGESSGPFRFCHTGCLKRFYVTLASEHIDESTRAKMIDNVYNASCPKCKGSGPVDIYGATKVTGLILAYRIESEERICCPKCGRSIRFNAFLHCLFMGWWSPKSLVINVFVLPYGLIRALLTMPPKKPSESLKFEILAQAGESIAPDHWPTAEESELSASGINSIYARGSN